MDSPVGRPRRGGGRNVRWLEQAETFSSSTATRPIRVKETRLTVEGDGGSLSEGEAVGSLKSRDLSSGELRKAREGRGTRREMEKRMGRARQGPGQHM